MILYCDTSALVKRYVEENWSNEVDTLWEDAIEIASSSVAFAETLSIFNRKLREGIITEKEYIQTITEFKTEYTQFIIVPISSELNKIIEKLCLKYSLRGFDAIHLASALLIQKNSNLTTIFACFDNILNKAAEHEGLDVSFLKK